MISGRSLLPAILTPCDSVPASFTRAMIAKLASAPLRPCTPQSASKNEDLHGSRRFTLLVFIRRITKHHTKPKTRTPPIRAPSCFRCRCGNARRIHNLGMVTIIQVQAGDTFIQWFRPQVNSVVVSLCLHVTTRVHLQADALGLLLGES
jgi:hypothetical protein